MYLENSEVNIGKYVVCKNELLGRGATGIVYKGYNIQTHTPVAIKDIDLKTINDDATKTLLGNQQKALKLINHPNVLKMQDIVTVQGHLYIITELLEGGTLQEMLSQRGPLSEEEAMSIFRQLLAGQDAVIQAGVIHRDLKPANILLTSSNVPKIIDFGYCQVILGGGIVRAFNVGSPSYMAPEALLRTLYSQKSDSWSLGVILFEMIHGRTPDNGKNVKQFLQQIKNNPQLIESMVKPGMNQNVREILLKSLQYQSLQRMSVSGMKYLVDVYFMNRTQTANRQPFSNLNFNTRHTLTSSSSQITKPGYKPLTNEPLNNRAVENYNNKSRMVNQQNSQNYVSNPIKQKSNNNNNGYISFVQFRQSTHQPQLRQSTHQPQFNSISNRNIPIQQPQTSMVNQYSRIGYQNATNSRGSSCLRQRPENTMQWGSTKNVGYEMQNRQRMMPSYREVKVRYL